MTHGSPTLDAPVVEDVLEDVLEQLDVVAEGEALYAFAEAAYPLCRSITGDGVRSTLDLLVDHFFPEQLADTRAANAHTPPLWVHEVPTGTRVLDWEVPREWSVRGARLVAPDGTVVVDFAEHNLHLMSYSAPFRGRLSFDDLRPHLFSLPERPTAIPYRTSYYAEHWGFCLRHELLERLEAGEFGEGEYTVEIDTSLEDGSLTYGELVLPGATDEIVLLSAHICHPSLANDNLSALAVAARLARLLATVPRRFTYRIVFAPGTIGAITWLARNREAVRRVRHGLVLANLGDARDAGDGPSPGAFHYKRSQREDATVDRAVAQVLAQVSADPAEPHEPVLEPFVPFGYDERQYCSPGFDLPVGLFSRTPWGRYPEYHTSDDDLSLLAPSALAGSLRRLLEIVHVLETDRRYLNLQPHGEPQLGRRGLYHHIGGGDDGRERQLALLWVLNQSDGGASLLDIAERSGVPYRRILAAARALEQAELLRPLGNL
ncbi:MAG: DUF4910 domain-containing protein [Acidobacteriota bacterium]